MVVVGIMGKCENSSCKSMRGEKKTWMCMLEN